MPNNTPIPDAELAELRRWLTIAAYKFKMGIYENTTTRSDIIPYPCRPDSAPAHQSR